MEEYDFPQQAIMSISSVFDKIDKSDGKFILKEMVGDYQNSCDINYDNLLVKIKEMSTMSGVCLYECILVTFLSFVEELKKYYRLKGYSYDVYQETVRGIKYKMQECYDLHGIYGATCGLGFSIYFSLKRFGIGILQFEVVDFNRTATINGITLVPTDKVINVHIPKSDKPFTKELRLDAYKKAKEFFKSYFKGKEKVPFYCNSWLLFNKHREILKPTSNLMAFMDEFTMFNQYEYSDYSETWRVFNKIFTRIEEMPQKTSLQKAYVSFIKEGQKTGAGEGVFFL